MFRYDGLDWLMKYLQRKEEPGWLVVGLCKLKG